MVMMSRPVVHRKRRPTSVFHLVSLVCKAAMEECNRERREAAREVKMDKESSVKGWSLVPSVV